MASFSTSSSERFSPLSFCGKTEHFCDFRFALTKGFNGPEFEERCLGYLDTPP